MAKKILFVEDEAASQKSLGFTLSNTGYEVVSALDGETGLRLAKSEKPDLVLLDLILPKMDGFEVLEQLKSDPETKEIPIIILTNLERMDDVERALALGAKTYLTKSSYSLVEVVEKVKKALGDA
ncbi:MAG: response regulator [Candidatus Gribaldobacteria bacterium]|nr:response regulator [Candidatus Gribaldobacteria bacterium]